MLRAQSHCGREVCCGHAVRERTGFVSVLANLASAQSTVVSGPETTDAGNERFEFLVDIEGGEGTFDTFELVIESEGLFNQFGRPAELLPAFFPTSEDSGVSSRLGPCFGFGCRSRIRLIWCERRY